MRPIGALAAALAVAVCSFGQHSTSGSGGAGHVAVSHAQPGPRPQPSAPPATSGTHIVPPSPGVAFPATGFNPPPFAITNPGFASSLGATVSGQGATGYRGYRRYRHAPAVVYGYPVYVGGYGDYGYNGGYADPGGYEGGYATDPAAGPQVIVNPNYAPERANPVIHEYAEDSSGVHVYDAPGREPRDTSADDGTDYYLIAFKDHSIYSAFAYWVDGETLHYVTPQRVHNQVSLALVDRELTEKLNRNRMQVKLPK